MNTRVSVIKGKLSYMCLCFDCLFDKTTIEKNNTKKTYIGDSDMILSAIESFESYMCIIASKKHKYYNPTQKSIPLKLLEDFRDSLDEFYEDFALYRNKHLKEISKKAYNHMLKKYKKLKKEILRVLVY